MVSAEHIVNAGECLFEPLRWPYNAVSDLEIILSCFRNGVQIPLFKGKYLDSLDPNNYPGITLLSTFNKIFEILVWNRLKGWWKDEHVMSCREPANRGYLASTQLFYYRRLWPRQWRTMTNALWASLTWPEHLTPCGMMGYLNNFSTLGLPERLGDFSIVATSISGVGCEWEVVFPNPLNFLVGSIKADISHF